MKRKNNLILGLLLLLIVASCQVNEPDAYKMIVPTGAPSIALSNFIDETEVVEVEIVSGSDPLVAAYSNQSYDIIVSPVNLGAKFYNQNENFDYVLYQPIVGCNYYLMSNHEILSFSELDGKELIAFNENSTPGVMLKALCAYFDVTPNITYLSSVSEANAYLVSGQAEYILSAEPSKTIISTKGTYYSLDINDLWQEMAGSLYTVPQAGIYVKKSLLEKESFKTLLKKMSESLKVEASVMALKAIKVDENLKSMNQNLLTKAIPNCHFITTPMDVAAVEFYFTKIMEFGLGKTIGGKLPDEAFYYQTN